MSKVVYLLGAGASYGIRQELETMDDVSRIVEGLPIVNEINDELRFIIGRLEDADFEEKQYKLWGKECDNYDVKHELIDGFEWLLKESNRHATIDTFAKKLYLKGERNDYGKLKFLLSTFFLLEQTLHPYDKRYDTFLANILSSDLNIPDDIYVMTWNYDVQFDLAYREYNQCGISMCVPPETRNTPRNSKLFKLNGSANYYGINNIDSSLCLNDNYKKLLDAIYSQLCVTTQNGTYSDGTVDLLFAWEKEKFDELSNVLYEKISDAEILVVIGYTFPFFNHEIDREVFSHMPKLSKIYIQDPNVNKAKFALKSILSEDRFRSLIKEENLIDDVSNFYLPPEL